MTDAEINRIIAIYVGWKFEPCQEWKDMNDKSIC